MNKEKPWTNIVENLSTVETEVYLDKYPVTEGHLLFVPTRATEKGIIFALRLALETGNDILAEGKCDGFNIGLNMGKAAGQTVGWPHVHLIPRHEGDIEDPTGGVRGVIPEKQKY